MSERVVWLVRHGQSAPSRCVDEANWPLTHAGERAAQALSERLAQLDADCLHSSPYARARATAAPLAAALGLAVAIDDDLRERALASGWLVDFDDAVRRAWADLAWQDPVGESGLDCQIRMLRCVDTASADGRRHLFFSHGQAIGLLLNHFDSGFGFDAWRRLRVPEVIELDLASGVWRSVL